MQPDVSFDGRRVLFAFCATDPQATNGQVYGPRWNFRGAPVAIGLEDGRVKPDDTASMWSLSEAQTGTVFNLGN